MLSLVICSINPLHLANIRTNIAESIGVPYELLVWDNRQDQLGLCDVYNKMASKASHSYLVFLHEDLLFETKGWGKELMDIFQSQANPALIGVAGGNYKGKHYSGWFSGIPGADFYHIFHEHGGIKKSNSNKDTWPSNEVPVCSIDGVFMAVKKNIWEQHPFNEQLLKGFHFYDLDFSLRIAHQNTVLVTKRINIVHLTQGGDYGDKWVEQAIIFHNAWNNNLPVMLNDHGQNAELQVAQTWLYRLKTEPIIFKNRIAWIKQQSLQNKPALLPAIAAFLGYKTLGFKAAFKLLKKLKATVNSR